MQNDSFYSEIYFSISRALLGEVDDDIAAIFFSKKENEIVIYFFFSDEANDERKNDMYCVGTEVIADFPNMMINEIIIELNNKKEIIVPKEAKPFFYKKGYSRIYS